MKLTLTLTALLLTPIASFAQETSEWPGPKWSTDSCPYDGQEVTMKTGVTDNFPDGKWGEAKIISILHRSKTDRVYFRWFPADAKVEALCGDKVIILYAAHHIYLETVVPLSK